MGHDVYANNLLISAKCADGKSIAAFPDTCMTPPPPPGVPVPYPNTSFSSDLVDGSKTVRIGGTEAALKDQSNFKTSVGDEGGCAPKHGIVTGKIKGKTYFTSWSMNVKIEGLNVVRHLDLTTHNHGSQPGNTPPWPYLDKMSAPPANIGQLKTLRATLLEVSFISDVPRVYRYAAKNQVKAPHWTKGEDVEDGVYSKKPAVYRFGSCNGKRDVQVIIKIDESTFGGNGTLRGKLGNLEMEGLCPLSVGEHVVVAQIKQLPDELTWIRRDATWELVGDAETTVPLESTFLEVFVIFDMPGKMFRKKGVWVDALRWLYEKVGVEQIADRATAVSKITEYCHSCHGLRYDTNDGASQYETAHDGYGKFQLFDYIQRTNERCNCYDQAAAIQSAAGALGLQIQWEFLMPFGYINSTVIVGIGRCNNPFFEKTKGDRETATTNDPKRTSFRNHAFCSYISKIHDACAGPSTGTSVIAQYLHSSIDTTPSLYFSKKYTSLKKIKLNYRPGTPGDVIKFAGVTDLFL